MHVQRPPYERRKRDGSYVWVLSLWERIGEKSYGARIDASPRDDAAQAWLQEHRAELRAGVSLRLELEDIHVDIRARETVMRGFFREPPEIAPPRYPAPAPATESLSPSQAAPA